MFSRIREGGEQEVIWQKIYWTTCTFFVCATASWAIFRFPNSYNFRDHDWYLGIQLIEVGKKFSENFNINPYFGFYNPSDPGDLLFGDHLFSSGMLIWSPDVLLFRFFSTVNCIKIHYLFSLFVAVYSLNYVRSRLKLGFLSALSLSLTWVLSGPIAGRMSEGHIQLTGYLFVPAFLCLVDEAIQVRNSQTDRRISLYFGFLFCFVASLGSTHVLVQFTLVLVIVGIFYRRARKTSFSAIFMGWLFSAFQFIPGALSPAFDWSTRSVYQGYGWRFWENFFDGSNYYQIGLMEFAQAMVKFPIEVAHHFAISLVDSTFAIQASGWEWTLGIGIFPTIMLTIINLKNAKEVKKFFNQRKYLILVLILSVGIAYRILFLSVTHFLRIPAVDRVPYRMGIYVFAALLLISFQNIDRIRNKPQLTRKIYSVCISVLIPILVGIQSQGWFERLQIQSHPNAGMPQVVLREHVRNTYYELSVIAGFLISIGSLLVAIIYMKRNSRRKAQSNSDKDSCG